MEFNFTFEPVIRLLISFLIGAAIGFEREYHGKVAGLRTMIMICLGSTIFTLISISIEGTSTDRIASNIITGIGFLGAGVIFKDGLTISGITTATAIWISAALGMAVGTGEYVVAFAGLVVVLIVLSVLPKITRWIDSLHQTRNYKIVSQRDGKFMIALQNELKLLHLNYALKKDMKDHENSIMQYEIYGGEKSFTALNSYLKNDSRVIRFEY